MPKYKIKKFENVGSNLSEIFQSVEIKFSFGRIIGPGEVEQVHEFVKCRDFLGDVIYAHKNDVTTSIYGMTFDPKKQAIHDDHLVLLLKFPSKDMVKTFRANTEIIDQCNRNNKVMPMGIEETEDDKILLTFSDRAWQRNMPLLSYYTFLMKVMGYKLDKPENWMAELAAWNNSTTEREYVKLIPIVHQKHLYKDAVSIFLGDTCVHGLNTKNIIDIHNGSGFYSICRKGSYNKGAFQDEWQSYLKASAGQPAPVKRAVKRPKKVAEAILAAA